MRGEHSPSMLPTIVREQSFRTISLQTSIKWTSPPIYELSSVSLIVQVSSFMTNVHIVKVRSLSKVVIYRYDPIYRDVQLFNSILQEE